MGKDQKKVLKWMIMAMMMVLTVVGAVYAITIPGFGKGDKVKAAKGTVTIPVTEVSDGKAHFYRFAQGDREIGFFVVKGSDGKIHTAFDACDVCYHEKKGYTQQGDYMICRNCNKRFAIIMIEGGRAGGCNPSHLSHQQLSGNIEISVNDLKTGARFF
ncbi:MAG TPA: DUF2318 domain-containing protein [Geobacteraceae bacterium]|nr:DUF2318 domain-containing protein [Geobacteraceae bacterium]